MLAHLIAWCLTTDGIRVLIETNVTIAQAHHLQRLNVCVRDVSQTFFVHLFAKVGAIQARQSRNRPTAQPRLVVVEEARSPRV